MNRPVILGNGNVLSPFGSPASSTFAGTGLVSLTLQSTSGFTSIAWSLSAPSGSSATLTSTTGTTNSFTRDVLGGTYYVTCTATGPQGTTETVATVVVPFATGAVALDRSDQGILQATKDKINAFGTFTGGATSFAGLSGRWSLSQVDNSSSAGKFLRDDGTWATVAVSQDFHTYASVAALPSSGVVDGNAAVTADDLRWWLQTGGSWVSAFNADVVQVNTTIVVGSISGSNVRASSTGALIATGSLTVGGTVAFTAFGAGFVRTSSGGALSSSALVAGDIPDISATYLTVFTTVRNTTTGTVAAAANTRIYHKATGAVTYQLPASPADKDRVEIERRAAGTGSVSIDGNGHNVDVGSSSGASYGPSTTLLFISLQYDATDGVWSA